MAPLKPGAERFFKPELDVLRFAAFFAVFLHHALPQHYSVWMQAGWSAGASLWLASTVRAGGLGVDLFFLLSAYLITSLLLREKAEQGRVAVGAFYARRALRIWPLYYAFLAFAAWVAPHLLTRERLPPAYLASFAGFVGNWICAFRGYPPSVANPLWSVSIEEQFYAVWPLLIGGLGARRLLPAAGALLAVATVTRIWLASAGVVHPGVWCHTLARLDPIAVGAVLAVRYGAEGPNLSAAARAALAAGAVATWVLVTAADSLAGWRSLWSYPAIALACAALLVASLRRANGPLSSSGLRALAWLGRISYGLYVFHFLAVALVTRRWGIEGWGRVPIAFALTLALAACSYRWLERPFLRLKARFTAVPSGASP